MVIKVLFGFFSLGQSYGHLYQPYAFGSAGGGGQGVGGAGGGMLWLNVTNMIEIDGELRSDGQDAVGDGGGGGSGGSIWMYCRVFRGQGKGKSTIFYSYKKHLYFENH